MCSVIINAIRYGGKGGQADSRHSTGLALSCETDCMYHQCTMMMMMMMARGSHTVIRRDDRAESHAVLQRMRRRRRMAAEVVWACVQESSVVERLDT
jgi:hypothetical protein